MVTNPRVLVAHTFPPETTGTVDEFTAAVRKELPEIDLVRATDYDDLLDRVPDADIVVEHSIDSDLLAQAGELAWVNTLSSGADSYDFDVIEELGAILTTVSGVHARPIAEHVLATMLYFERGLDRSLRQQTDREWCRFPAGELGNQTIGIIGTGSVGGRVAELASAFGMTVLGMRQHPSKGHPAVDEMFGHEDRHELLGRSDYLVIACSLTEETRGLIGRKELSSLSNDDILVNVARGEVVDQDALVDILQTGYIGGAALDVAETEPLPPDSPLWTMSNVIVTPHMAGGSPAFPERCAELFVENYRHLVNDRLEAMQNRVA